VHALRATAAVWRAKDTYAPNIGFRRAAAQRVLASQVIAQKQVDVSTRRPRREFGAARVGKGEQDNVIGDGPRFSHHKVGLVLPDDRFRGRHCHNRVRLSQQPTFVWIRTIAAGVAGDKMCGCALSLSKGIRSDPN